LAPGLVAAPLGGQAIKTLRSFNASPVSESVTATDEAAPAGAPVVVDEAIAELPGVVAPPEPALRAASAVDEPASIHDGRTFASFELPGAAETSEEIPAAMNVFPPVEIVGRPSIEAPANPVVSELAAPIAAAGWKAGAHATAYLPNGGPLPLRFAEPKGWPKPLPVEAARHRNETADSDSSSTASNTGMPGVDDAESIIGDETTSELTASSPATDPHDDPYPDSGDKEQPVLTADLVLDYMSGVSGDGGLQRDSFLPAMPASAIHSSSIAKSQP
ncbi:MAG: hypothetical protein ACREIA_06725, partial [Opitutaceae bacterium]